MDSFFGIGIAELFFIALIALVVLGPERLPGAIREVSKFLRTVRNLTNELTSQFNEEIKAFDDLNPQKILRELTEDPDEKKPDEKKDEKKPAAKPAAKAAATTTAAAVKPAPAVKPATPKTGTANDAPKPVIKSAAKPANPTATPTTNPADPAASLPRHEQDAERAAESVTAQSAQGAADTWPDDPEPSILPPVRAQVDADKSTDLPPTSSPPTPETAASEMVVETPTPAPAAGKVSINGSKSSTEGDA